MAVYTGSLRRRLLPPSRRGRAYGGLRAPYARVNVSEKVYRAAARGRPVHLQGMVRDLLEADTGAWKEAGKKDHLVFVPSPNAHDG